MAVESQGDRYYIPVTAHFAASARNFVMAETRLSSGRTLDDLIVEQLEVVNGKLAVPTGPGLGITVVEEAVRASMAPGEPNWD